MGAACGARHASILRRGGRRGCAASSCHSAGSLPSRPCRLDFSIVLGTGCAPWPAPLPAASIEPMLLGTQSGISTISRVGTDNYIYIFFFLSKCSSFLFLDLHVRGDPQPPRWGWAGFVPCCTQPPRVGPEGNPWEMRAPWEGLEVPVFLQVPSRLLK